MEKNKFHEKTEVTDIQNLEEKRKLVFGGGGLRGFAYIGVIRYLEERNILKNIRVYLGTSIGSIFATLVSIGLTSTEMESHFSFSLSILQVDPIRLIHLYGIDSGNHVMQKIRKAMETRVNPNITFSDLHKLNGKTLVISSTCLEKSKVVYFDHETSPDLKVIDAIRMSIGVPILFTAVKYKGLTFVDGGVLENYPDLFDSEDPSVLGFCLVSEKKTEETKIRNVLEYTQTIVQIFFDQIQTNESKNVIYIRFPYHYRSFDFSMSETVKREYIELGYKTTKKVLHTEK